MPKFTPKSGTPKHNNTKSLASGKPAISGTPFQDDLPHIEKQIEKDGIGMGVLTDGTPFLTGRGLARLCGIHSGRLSEMNERWGSNNTTTMAARVRRLLIQRGADMDKPFIDLTEEGPSFLAYSDLVCVAVLEYYAFDAPTPVPEALANFRLLAGKALREFIFAQVGYDPAASVAAKWRQFHDRVELTHSSVPEGFFGIFKELSEMVVTLGQAGLLIDEHFVPDISVGLCWAKHWDENGFSERFGERIKYEHNYPDYFPQARSNPQEPWCYPEEALGAFRKWLRETYIGGGRFKTYIEGKVKQKDLPISFAQLALAAYGIDDKKAIKKSKGK